MEDPDFIDIEFIEDPSIHSEFRDRDKSINLQPSDFEVSPAAQGNLSSFVFGLYLS